MNKVDPNTTIDLSLLNNAITVLTDQYNIDYAELVKLQKNIKPPKKYKINTERGEAWTRGLLKTNDIAVAETIVVQNTMVNLHTHNEYEIIYVKSGKLILTIEGNVIELDKGSAYLIQPKQKHDAYWPIESEILAITLPASTFWPEVDNGQ